MQSATYRVSASSPLDDGVEAVDLVGGVGDLPQVAVGLHQAVGAVHDAVLQRLLRVLVVAGVRVLNPVRVAVGGVGVHGLSYYLHKPGPTDRVSTDAVLTV